MIDEFDGLRLVCDSHEEDGQPDVVRGATEAARTLAALIVRRPVARALDLGTGCGVLALTLARHSDRVVGTDGNPRAIDMARRSAELSSIGNVEWRAGDWYEPVAGERFDLITCNPPHVLTPDELVRAAGDHLVPGGLAHFLVNWSHGPGDWAAPLRGWVPAGCDALALRLATRTPREHAATWLRAGDDVRWLDWYRERGIEAIGAGLLVIRRRDSDDDDAPLRLRALEATAAPTPRAGRHVERILAGIDLAAAPDDVLLASRLRLAGPEEPSAGVRADVPAEIAGLDGTRPLGEVLPASALPAVREGLERGVVIRLS
jgi:SAM-dependent methyltransferase